MMKSMHSTTRMLDFTHMEEFVEFELNNKKRILEAEVKHYTRATKKELEQKPIYRDQNDKPIDRGSFWQRKPYDYSTMELNLDQDHPDLIRSQILSLLTAKGVLPKMASEMMVNTARK